MVPRKSHLGAGQRVAWLLPSGAPPAHYCVPVRRPWSKQKRALGLDRGFSKASRAGPDRAETSGAGGGYWALGLVGQQGGSNTSPILQLGLAEAWERGLSSLLRPGPWTGGRSKGGALSAPVSPRPWGGSAGSGLPWRHLLADAGVQVRSASRASVPPASLPSPAP